VEFLLVVLFVALGIAAIWAAIRAAHWRREAMAALAARLGWHFDPREDRDHDDEYAHFEIFRRGSSRRAYNTLSGHLEIDGRTFPAKAGDFSYAVTSSNGKTTTTTTHRFSYLILHLPLQAPDLLIRREGLFDKLAAFFGFDDIDFESAEFSRRYCVKSKDRRFAYDVVHPRMIEFLLAHEAPSIDIENGRLCLSDGSSTWKPEQFERQLAFARQFFDLWPEHLLAEIA
jgi:hypothetical protein